MNLLGALAKLGSLTMVSHIPGLVCDTTTARVSGAGDATDAFLTTFKLPNLLRRISVEGAFSQAFVPVLAEYRQTKSPEATREFVQYVAGMLTFVLTIATAVGVLVAPRIIRVTMIGFGKNPGELALAADLLRVMFPYILLISPSSFVGSILNTYHKFQIPALMSVLLNISFIVVALFFVPYSDPPITVLARAVPIDGVLWLVFQLPWPAKQGFLKLPKLDLRNSAVNRVIKLMIPLTFAASVAQVSLVISTIFASYLQSGSITWMHYADHMTELPTGVLGVAFGMILLPTLSKYAGGCNSEEFSKLLDWGLWLCFLLVASVTLVLAVLSLPLISTLFMSKDFTYHDAVMTRNTLAACSFCAVGQVTVKVLAPAFYVQQNTRMPIKIVAFMLVIIQLMNLAFVGPLEHVGLSLPAGLGACLNAGLLLTLLRKHGIYLSGEDWRPLSVKLLVAFAVMGGGLLAVQYWLPMDWQHAGGLRKAGQLSVLIFIGRGPYFASLAALGFRPYHFKRPKTK